MPDGRQLLRELTPRGETAKVSLLDLPITGLPSIAELSEKITFSKLLEIIGPTAELRLTENDQTDPAGRYRQRVTADNFLMEHALTADWATDFDFFAFDHVNSRMLLDASHGTGWTLGLQVTNVDLILRGNATAASANIALRGGVTDRLIVYGDGTIQFSNTTPAFLSGLTSSDQSTFDATAAGNTPLIVTKTVNAVSNQVAIFASLPTTRANNDEGYATFRSLNTLGTATEVARMTHIITDVTNGSEDGALLWSVRVNNVLTSHLRLGSSGTALTWGVYGATAVVQGAAVADASGGATIDAEARTAINALLARIRSTGIIAT